MQLSAHRPTVRRTGWRPYLLSALLVLTQLGAVLHALGHVGAVDEGSFSADSVCEWCVGFAPLATACAGPQVRHPPLIAAADEVAGDEPPSVSSNRALPYRVRAPPAFS